jgi:hypothetical protein
MQDQYIPTAYNHKDITGQTFNQLTAIEPAGKTVDGKALWLCKCSCGQMTIVQGRYLRSGHTRSCGCLVGRTKQGVSRPRSHGVSRPRSHGMSKTRVYRIWQGMLQRCENPRYPNYKSYGERGITVCEAWQHSFETFYNDMGEPPTIKHTLDRTDNNSGYFRENCRWITQKEQCRNTRQNVMITYDGRTQCISAWEEELGMRRCALHVRIVQHGWSIERAFTTPINTKFGRSRKVTR